MISINQNIKSLFELLESLEIECDEIIKTRLTNKKIDVTSFLHLEGDELIELGFKYSAIKIIKKQLKAQNEAREIQKKLDNIKADHLNLIKMLHPQRLPCENHESEFASLIMEELNLESLRKAFRSSDLTTGLKPFLLDCLKRNSSIKNLKEEIINSLNKLNLSRDEINSIELMTEQNLLSSLIESVSEVNKPRLGYLISKNDHPMPLAYEYFCHETNHLQTRINFGIFTDVFCATDKCLALISGTKSSCKKGKSSLIPLLFSGLKGSVDMAFNTDNLVDLISSNDVNNEWLIADFHGQTNEIESLNLLRSIKAYSTIHIFNTTLQDFDRLTQKPYQEIENILREYQDAEQNPKLIILVRDVNETDEKLRDIFDEVSKQMNLIYNKKHIHVEGIPNLELLKSKKNFLCQNEVLDRLNRYIGCTQRKKFHSIQNIKHLYNKLMANDIESIQRLSKSSIESSFDKIFNLTSIQKNKNSIYSVSKLNKKIHQVEKKLKNLANSFEDSKEIIKNLSQDLKELLTERSQLEPFNEQMQFFIRLILDIDEKTCSNLFVFEKCLESLAKENSKMLYEKRVEQATELNSLRNKLKSMEINQEQSANDDKLNELRRKVKESEETVELLDNQIDDIDLKLDKFWDELFLIFEWLDEFQKNNQNTEEIKQQMILKYTKLLSQGFNIHLLRGNPLKLESKFIEQVLKNLTASNKDNEKIYVVSIIGEQSSAKSSLLNSLFGFDFKTSVGRCTNGIYMNFVRIEGCIIVILDTEGLMSVESGNQVFDNQMATMAVLSSHLILVNHKGEISSNLERLLGITFYAKLRISKSSFKPSILFVLRDQMDRDKAVIAAQATKLKEKLMKQTQFIEESLDSILDIDTRNVILLPNAFSEDQHPNGGQKTLKWRNALFPSEILKARQFLVKHLLALDTNGHTFNSLNELYSRMSFDWRTLEDIGEGIMSCRDLEELRVRNEISKKSNALIDRYMQKLTNECNDLISNSLVTLSTHYSSELSENVIEELEELHQANKAELLAEYNKQTNVSFYPEALKQEYHTQIENSLNYIISLNLKKMKAYDANLKQKNILQQEKKELIEEFSEIIKVNNDSQTIENILDLKIKESYSNHSRRMSEIYRDDHWYINQIQKDLNIITFRKRHLCNSVFELVSTIHSLDSIFMQKEEFGKFDYKFENWMEKNFCEDFDKIKPIFYSILKEIEEEVAVKAITKMNSYYIEHLNLYHAIINAIYLIEDYYRKQHISALFREKFLKIRKLLIEDSIHIVLYYIYKRLIELREYSKKRQTDRHEETIKELKRSIITHLNNANDSKAAGQQVAKKILNETYNFLIEKEKIISTNQILFKIDKILKSPQNLIQMAFNKSFDCSNYKNVLKYVKNINNFCLEICELETQQAIQQFWSQKFQIILESLKNFKEFLTKFKSNASSIYSFLDDLKKSIESGELNYFCELIDQVKSTLIDSKIDNIPQFLSIFNSSFYDPRQIFPLKDFKQILRKYFDVKTSKYFKNYLGCESKCPGCGSKCHLESGHTGKHESDQHILNSFTGWSSVRTNVICLDFCWEKKFYLNPVLIGDKSYDTFELYVKSAQKKWFFDVESNYIKYGKNPDNDISIEFKTKIIKAWMNTRIDLINFYSTKNRQIFDAEYTQDWLNYE